MVTPPAGLGQVSPAKGLILRSPCFSLWPSSKPASARRRKELGILPARALQPQGQEPASWVREGWPVPGAARGACWLWGLKTVIHLLKVGRSAVIRGEMVLPKNLSEF